MAGHTPNPNTQETEAGGLQVSSTVGCEVKLQRDGYPGKLEDLDFFFSGCLSRRGEVSSKQSSSRSAHERCQAVQRGEALNPGCSHPKASLLITYIKLCKMWGVQEPRKSSFTCGEMPRDPLLSLHVLDWVPT